MNSKFCPSCGEPNNPAFKVCWKCHCSLEAEGSLKPHPSQSPILNFAAHLSKLLPGSKIRLLNDSLFEDSMVMIQNVFPGSELGVYFVSYFYGGRGLRVSPLSQLLIPLNFKGGRMKWTVKHSLFKKMESESNFKKSVSLEASSDKTHKLLLANSEIQFPILEILKAFNEIKFDGDSLTATRQGFDFKKSNPETLLSPIKNFHLLAQKLNEFEV